MRLPFRGGETSNEDSFRGDCWLRKRSSSILSFELFAYAILNIQKAANSQNHPEILAKLAEEGGIQGGVSTA
jgi:hypothetical protein